MKKYICVIIVYLLTMEGLLGSAAAWLVANIRWGHIFGCMRTRLSVFLCQKLVGMADEELIRDVCITTTFTWIMDEVDFHYLFRLLLDNTRYHWGHYVVFMTWVSERNGDDMARRIDKKIRKEYPQYVPSIPYLIAAWIRAGCGPDRTHDE